MRPTILKRDLLIIKCMFFSSLFVFGNIQNDTIQIKKKLGYAIKARSQNLDTSFLRAYEALELAQSSGEELWEAKCYAIMGGILSLKSSVKEIQESNMYTQKAYEIFKNYGDSLRMQRCLINKSNNYLSLYKYPEALEYSVRALNLVKKIGFISEKKKKGSLASTYGTLGRTYWALKLTDSSLYNYEKSYDLFSYLKRPEASIVALNVADIYYYQDKLLKSGKYYEDALEISRKHNFESINISASNGVAKILISTEKYIEAKNRLKQTLRSIKMDKYPHKESETLFYLSKTYHYLKKKDSAYYFLQKALKKSETIRQTILRVAILKFQADLLEIDQNYSKANIIRLDAYRLEDSIQKNQNTTAVTRILLRDQKEKANEKNKSIISTQKYQKQQIWIGVFLLIVLIIVLVIITRNLRKKSKLLFQNSKRLTEKYNNTQKEKIVISKKMVSITANLALQNELLNETNKLLKQIKKQIDNNTLQSELSLTQNRIKQQLQLDKIWDDFFYHFEEIDKSFIQKLKKNYKLTPKDLKICAFIKMGLSIKEISRLLNINHGSVSVSLYRLKNKMNVPEHMSASEFIRFNI